MTRIASMIVHVEIVISSRLPCVPIGLVNVGEIADVT